MIFNKLRLFQFKNHPSAEYRFPARITGICGPNGSGKTNLLDALYFLSFTRSYFSKSDAASVQYEKEGFRIEGELSMGQGEEKISVVLRESGKKEISVNQTVYPRVSAHIGRYPAVMIAPDDIELITGGSEERRKFTDSLLCQMNPEYLSHLMQYNKILQQRNSYLKSLAENRKPDTGLLDVYDTQLIAPGDAIFSTRSKFFQNFAALVNRFYAEISGKAETIAFEYASQLSSASMGELLNTHRSRDLAMQRTGSGIHKDDLVFTMMEQPFKSIASQGQRKSLLFALKLSAYETLRENKGFPPLLLLDDVFEKLDARRMNNLLQRVCLLQNGQVFITDTHRDRLENALKDLGVEFGMVELGNFKF